VVEADPAELDGARSEIRERFGYEARFTHFPIVGLCTGCAGEGAAR
jgi:Fur family transcriptional regulator, ferric uptake regulator